MVLLFFLGHSWWLYVLSMDHDKEPLSRVWHGCPDKTIWNMAKMEEKVIFLSHFFSCLADAERKPFFHHHNLEQRQTSLEWSHGEEQASYNPFIIVSSMSLY